MLLLKILICEPNNRSYSYIENIYLKNIYSKIGLKHCKGYSISSASLYGSIYCSRYIDQFLSFIKPLLFIQSELSATGVKLYLVWILHSIKTHLWDNKRERERESWEREEEQNSSGFQGISQAACQMQSRQLDNRYYEISDHSINTTTSCFQLMSDDY